ncbi:MAG: aldo/keto reductase [Pseudonocardia sp. 73-21]|nr:MAG: aldo/keto reductase [Pseudonocardia sp. 73-21]
MGAIGLGCMGMSGAYGPADESESVATIRAALDAGVTLVDTGDFYGMGHNELLVGRALRDLDREHVTLSVKFGAMRPPGGGVGGFDGRPEAVGNFLSYSLVRLGVDHIDIYRPARLDPNVPIEDTVGAIADLVEKGYVRHIGLSEVGADTIRRAAAVHPITDLQIEYSLLTRGIEDDILPVCRELGIGVTAYGVLSRGLIGGGTASFGQGDFRSMSPRFQGGNFKHNRDLVARLEPIAQAVGVSVGQLAIAWVAAQGDDIVPVIGIKNSKRLGEAVQAVAATLSSDELASIGQAVPRNAAHGDRYPAAGRHSSTANDRPAASVQACFRVRRPQEAPAVSRARSSKASMTSAVSSSSREA